MSAPAPSNRIDTPRAALIVSLNPSMKMYARVRTLEQTLAMLA